MKNIISDKESKPKLHPSVSNRVEWIEEDVKRANKEIGRHGELFKDENRMRRVV